MDENKNSVRDGDVCVDWIENHPWYGLQRECTCDNSHAVHGCFFSEFRSCDGHGKATFLRLKPDRAMSKLN